MAEAQKPHAATTRTRPANAERRPRRDTSGLNESPRPMNKPNQRLTVAEVCQELRISRATFMTGGRSGGHHGA